MMMVQVILLITVTGSETNPLVELCITEAEVEAAQDLMMFTKK